jgi:hypothetical protein
MKQKLFLFLTVLFFAFGSAHAQQQETLLGGSPGITGAWFSLNRNYSEFDADEGTARGYTIGLEIGKQFMVGYARERIREEPLIGPENEPFDLSSRGGFISYSPLAYKAIHPRFSMMAGVGNADLGDTDLGRVLVLRPSVGVELNVVKWFRIGVEGGYRHIDYDDIDGFDSDEFSSWFLELGFRFGITWDD